MKKERDSFGWGLIGPGRFAREFASELRNVGRAKLVAVASRNVGKAESFAHEYGFEKSYGCYDELFEDDEIDIVYIVVPHVFHRELSERAIESGKAVLCEKPLTPSVKETESLVRLARERNVFLMEAMKTGFLPAIAQARRWIEEGEIGKVLLARADFCFQGPTDPGDRLMNPDLAGGAVLDVGIYPLYLARYFLGEVEELQAFGSLASTGVEDAAAIVTRHESGASAALTCSFRTEEAMDAVIQGTEGEIILPQFHAGSRAELRQGGSVVEVCQDDSGGMVSAEIEAVMDSLSRGEIECPGHSHKDTIRLAEAMESVRSQLGVIQQGQVG